MRRYQLGEGLVRQVCIAAAIAIALGAQTSRLEAQEVDGPDRGSFTLILDVGLGLQHDGFFGRTEPGWGGLNLGIGGFVTDDAALMFRLSGTTVTYGAVQQSSGVMGPALQYWTSDRFFITAGVGAGFWGVDGDTDGGLGFILGGGYALLNSGKHNLQLGIEYAPAFTEPDAVHSVGITVGWQLL